MVCVLVDSNCCQGGFGWHAPFNKVWLCRGLGNPILTRTTRILGAARDQHTKLGWHDVQTLGDIFANNVTFAAADDVEAMIRGWCAVVLLALPEG